MKFKHFSWINCFGTTTPQLVDTCEKELEVQFPEIFKSLVTQCNGGTPEKNIFNYYSCLFKTYEQSSIGLFLLFSDEKIIPCERFSDYYKNPPPFFPEGLVAFAIDGGGNLICFDYRDDKNNSNPPIVIWENEGFEEKKESPLAPNFEAFMNMLMSEEEAEEDFKKLLEKSKENK